MPKSWLRNGGESSSERRVEPQRHVAHRLACCLCVCVVYVHPVARSRQVCIYVVEALLIAIYLGNDLILIDIRKPSAERLSRPI